MQLIVVQCLNGMSEPSGGCSCATLWEHRIGSIDWLLRYTGCVMLVCAVMSPHNFCLIIGLLHRCMLAAYETLGESVHPPLQFPYALHQCIILLYPLFLLVQQGLYDDAIPVDLARQFNNTGLMPLQLLLSSA